MKKMAIKIATALLSVCCACFLTGIVACSDDEEESILDPGFSIITPTNSSFEQPSSESVDTGANSSEIVGSMSESEASEEDGSIISEEDSNEQSASSEMVSAETSYDSELESGDLGGVTPLPTPGEHTHNWLITRLSTPDCIHTGSEIWYCDKCGTSKTVTIPALGHVTITIPGQEPTCKDYGWTESSKCLQCATIFTFSETLPKTNDHTIVDNRCTICDYTEILYDLTPSGYYVCIGSIFSDPTELVIADTYKGRQVRGIKEKTFYECYSLTRITLGENITEIGDKAFFDCYNLFEIYNKSDMPLTPGSTSHGYIAEYARDIYTDVHESKIKNDNGVITYTDSVNNEVIFLGYYGPEIEITLPEGITRINNHSFSASKLVEVTFASTVKRIDESAFFANKLLEKINLNAELEYIDKTPFKKMEKILQIVFAQPEGWMEYLPNVGEARSIQEYIRDPYEAVDYFSQESYCRYYREN